LKIVKQSIPQLARLELRSFLSDCNNWVGFKEVRFGPHGDNGQMVSLEHVPNVGIQGLLRCMAMLILGRTAITT